LGVKEQEVVIARLTEQVNIKRYSWTIESTLIARKFLEELREMNIIESRSGAPLPQNDGMHIDSKAEESSMTDL